MKRTYAASRLLEHGALTFADFLTITGWRKTIANKVLAELRSRGLSKLQNINGRRHHAMAS